MSTVIVSHPVRPALSVSGWAARIVTRWHLLSLDAPTVAVAWLFLLNTHCTHRELSIAAPALAIAVWMIYVADRLLDAYKRNGGLHDRHRFHWRNRRAFFIGFVLSAAMLGVLLPFLPNDLLHRWPMLALPLAVYAAFVHFRWVRVPKEFVVGAFFAVVVGAPLQSGVTGASHTAAVLSFGLLCCCNCLAITSWESGARAAQKNAAPVLRQMLVLLVGACVVCLFLPQTAAVGVSALTSAALLFALHRNRLRLEPLLLRSLADVALLTPLLVLPFLRHR